MRELDGDTGHAGPATLGQIVADLGLELLTVVAAPAGLDVPVRQVAILDPAEAAQADPGDLVLGVGLTPADANLATVLETLARAGVAGLVVKSNDREPRLAELAEAAGVAVLTVTPAIAWGQLHTLARTAVASSGQAPDDGAGPSLGNLFALANSIAMMVGGPVTIEDTRSRVLAYSSLDEPLDEGRRATILGRKVPDEWIERLTAAGVFKRLWGGTDVIRIDTQALSGEDTMVERLAIAVRAGDEILGSIWVAQGRVPLGPEAEEALRQAARIAALHLVRHRASDDMDRRMRGDLLRALLDGRGSVGALASRLGLEVDAPCVVVAFELDANDEATVAVQRERAWELVAMHCEAFRRRSVLTTLGRTLYALLPLTDTTGIEGVRRLTGDVLDRAGTVLSVPLFVGIGSVAEDLRDAARSRHEADKVTRILAARAGAADAQRLAHVDDVRPQVVLLDLRDHVETNPQLLVGHLQHLVAEDQERGSAYVATLQHYLDAFGDIPAAASRMNVHPNTFRYRLKRACEIAGIDLDDPDERLVLALQLRLV